MSETGDLTILKIDNFTADDLKEMQRVFTSTGWRIIRDKWLKVYQDQLAKTCLSLDCTDDVHHRIQSENILLEILINKLSDHAAEVYKNLPKDK